MISNQNRRIIFNSTLLFVSASILEMTLHELGHFLMGGFLGAKERVLYHNYVADSDAGLTLTEILLIKGAGPAVSLIIGIIFHVVCSKQKERGMQFLFNLYLSVFGYIGFFGYLMIAPFFTNGDTGYTCNALGFPLWLTTSIAILAGLVVYFLMFTLMRFFVELGTKEIASQPNLRIPFIHSLILYPLLISIPITILLNLPIPTWLSLIAPLCSPFTILWTYGQALSREFPTDNMNPDLKSISRIQGPWIIVFVMIVVLNRILVTGISFG